MEEIENILKNELKRLNKLNNSLEKNIDDIEQIVDNVKAMCGIANTISILHANGIF